MRASLLSILFCIGALATGTAQAADPVLRFDEKTLGAIPGDGLDDSPALQKALDQLVAAGGGTLEVPSGVFDIMSRVAVEGEFRDLRIIGTGQGLARLVCRNSDGLLKITATNPEAAVEIRDIDLPPGQAAAGTCLELVKPYSEPADREQNLLLSNLELRPENLETDYYRRVFVAEGWMPLLDNINTSGLYGPKFNTFEGKRKKYQAESIVVLKQAYKPRIQYANLWAAEYGVIIELTDAHPLPTMNASVSVENAHGIHITKLGDRPQTNPLVIDGCHWNNAFSGLVLKGIQGFRLVQNCLYGASDIEKGYSDIRLEDCSNGELLDNSFWFAVMPRIPVSVGADCHDITIRNSLFGRGVAIEPVVVEPGAKNISISGSLFDSVYALDEEGTFGLWEMEETNGEPAPAALDKGRIDPDRKNHLLIEGATFGPGSATMKLGQAILFPGGRGTARSSKPWPGAKGLRLQAHLKIDPSMGVEESTVAEVAGVFRLFLADGDLRFTYIDAQGKPTTLSVQGIMARRDWIPILAEVNPELGRVSLEVGMTGSDRRDLENLALNKASAPLVIAPDDGHRRFSGGIDQVWLRQLATGAGSTPVRNK
jgi:hypothetical protein